MLDSWCRNPVISTGYLRRVCSPTLEVEVTNLTEFIIEMLESHGPERTRRCHMLQTHGVVN